MTMGSWYVYVVRCARNALYTGITPDLKKRIQTHNAGKGAKALKALGLPVHLVYSEQMDSHGEALRRERSIKKMTKIDKEKLIRGDLPEYPPHISMIF